MTKKKAAPLTLERIPTSKAKATKDNPRRSVGDVTELAASVKAAGILEPVIAVATKGGGWEVVVGTRRLAAAKKAGLKEIPAIVHDKLDPKTRAEVMLIENLQREDLLPTEEAAALAHLLKVGGYSQRTLANRIGRSQAVISKRLALLRLPAVVQKDVDSGRITLADAEQLIQLADHPEALQRVLKRPDHQTVAQAAGREVQQIETAKKHERAIAEAKRGKAPFVEATPDKWGAAHLPDGIEYVGEWQAVGVKPKEHTKLKCHAVTVDGRGSIVPVCTDPDSHPVEDDDDSPIAGWRERDRGREEQTKKLHAIAKDRRAFVTELIGQPRPSKDESFTLLVDAAIACSGQTPKAAACKLLEIDAPKGGAYNSRDYAKGLREYAADGETARLRVALALALGWTEESLPTWGGASWADHQQHFAFLEANGYKVTPEERDMLKGKDISDGEE